MALSEKLKETLGDQIEAWEKQLQEKEAELARDIADNRAEASRKEITKETREQIRKSIETLIKKLEAAKEQIAEKMEP